MSGKPLLTLETLAPDRPTIAINDVEYELALPSDFGLREEAENARLLRKAASLLEDVEKLKSEDLPPDQATKLEELLDGFIAVILRAPDEVRSKLRFRQQIAVIEVFTEAVTPKAPATPRPTRRPSTSAPSTRGSARRTAPRTGSRSRSASSPHSSR